MISSALKTRLSIYQVYTLRNMLNTAGFGANIIFIIYPEFLVIHRLSLFHRPFGSDEDQGNLRGIDR